MIHSDTLELTQPPEAQLTIARTPSIAAGRLLHRLALAARRGAPGPVKFLGRGALIAADPLTINRYRATSGYRGPIPGRRLRASVGVPSLGEFMRTANTVPIELARLVSRAGEHLRGKEAVYEWGCGVGRILTRLPTESDRIYLAGSDVNVPAIEWMRRHHPAVDARVNAPDPPTTFQSDRFDFVYAISVLTHLDERRQDEWLTELIRLLRPGSLAVLTIMSAQHLETYRAGMRPGVTSGQVAELRRRNLAEDGLVHVADRATIWNPWARPVAHGGHGLTFHDDDYVRAHFSRWFTEVEIVPDAINWGQDAVLARCPD